MDRPSVSDKHHVIWIGHRGLDATAFRDSCPLAGIVCCDWSEGHAELARHVPIASLERNSRNRRRWSSSALDQLDLRAFLGTLSSRRASRLMVVPYRSMHRFEAALPALIPGGTVYAAPLARLVDVLDDKAVQRRLFSEWGLPVPEWQVCRGRDLPTVLPAFGERAVVQVRRGSLGLGTFAVFSGGGLPAVPADQSVIVSRWIDGICINIHACAGREHVHVSWPSVQLVGLAECNPPNPQFSYCGNDFGAAQNIAPAHIAELIAWVMALGHRLRQRGYRGLFGSDWIRGSSGWQLLEINPRFQGSTALLADRERAAGEVPLVVEHLRSFVDDDFGFPQRDPANPQPLAGSQRIVYMPQDGQHRASCAREENGEPTGLRSGFPTPGTHLDPGCVLGRILTLPPQ